MHFNIKHKMFLQIVYLYLNGISNQGNFQVQENSDLISLTFAGDGHHRLPGSSREAEAPGQAQLGDDSEGVKLLTAASLSSLSLLEADRAAALPLVALCWYTEVVTVALVGQTRVLCGDGPLPEHHHGPQVHLVINQSLGIVSVREVHPHNLLVDGVKVVESPLHDGQGHRLIYSLLVYNCPSVAAVAVDDLDLRRITRYT